MRESFYGWYMKCQSDTQTLAVIPAVHLRQREPRVNMNIEYRFCKMRIFCCDSE